MDQVISGDSEWAAILSALAVAAGIVLAVLAEVYIRQTGWRIDELEDEIARLRGIIEEMARR